MAEKTRVFCVDDHDATSGLYRLILDGEPDLKFAGSLLTTEGLMQAIEETHAAVLMLDLMIPGCDTLRAMEELHARFPSLAVLIVSGLDEPRVIEEAFRRGAQGFFLKTLNLAELPDVIRRVARGESVNTATIIPRDSGGSSFFGAYPSS